MKLAMAHNLLAVPPGSGQAGAEDFLGTSAGKFLVACCGILAVVIVVMCVLKMLKAVSSSRPGEAMKALAFGLIIGGLLFNLNLTIKGVNAAGDVIGKVFDSLPLDGGGGDDGDGGQNQPA